MAWIRMGRPELGNPYYNTRGNSGYSTAIVGNPMVKGLNTLYNCVGSANGCFNETYVRNTGLPPKEYFPLTAQANLLVNRAKSLGLKTLGPQGYPPLGGLIVWQDTHVAYICEVSEDGNSIVVQQTGYQTASWKYTNNKPLQYTYNPWDSSLPGWNIRRYDRNSRGPNYWGYGPNGCVGFIVNPAIGEGPQKEDPSIIPAQIYSVTQTSQTSLHIEGTIGGIQGITTDSHLYYKWNSNTASSSNFDGMVTASSGGIRLNRSYGLDIDKPHEAESIAIQPYQINTGYENYAGILYQQSLVSSIPCIYLQNNYNIVQSIPYIYNKGTIKRAVPLIYHNNTWYELWEDKKG